MRKSAPFSAQLADAIGKALAEYVAAKVDPLLERIAELEERKGLHDAGVWQGRQGLRRGRVVYARGLVLGCQVSV